MMGSTVVEKTGKLPFFQKFGYGFSGIAFCFCQLIPTFLVYYATESLALAVGAVTLMMMLVKILDGVTDIVAGIIVDKTNTKTGKARPWFLRVAIPYAVCMILMFSVPTDWGTAGKMAMLAIFYALTVSVFGTFLGVARLTLISRMTKDPRERGLLGVLGDGIACVCIGIGMAAGTAIAGMVGWTITFIFFGIIAFVACMIVYALTRENNVDIDAEMTAAKERKNSGLKAFFKAVFTNKYIFLLLVYILIQQMAGGTITAGGLYYFQYVYGDINGFSQMMVYTVVAAVIAIFVCPFIVKAIGSKAMFASGCILAAACYVIMIIAGGNLLVLMICLALSQVFGQMFLMTQAGPFAAAVGDYSKRKNGQDVTAITSAVVNIGIKVGTAIATGLMGLIMSIGGYVEGGVEQTERAVNSIYVSYMIVPLILFAALAVIFLTTFRLKIEKQEEA